MAHSVSEAAARAVKNSQRVAVETRTPDQRLADIRKNRQAKLFVTPDDQDFLLAQYDHATSEYQTAVKFHTARNCDVLALHAEIADLKGQLNAQYASQKPAVVDFGTGSDGIGTPDMP